MTPERWRQVEGIYHAVLERLPQERAAYLDQACTSDDALRGEVQSFWNKSGS